MTPAAIIFVNADLNDQLLQTLCTQLEITEVVSNGELNARLSADPNYTINLHLNNLRILVILPSYHQTVSYQRFIPAAGITSNTSPVITSNIYPTHSDYKDFLTNNIKQNWFPPINSCEDRFSDGYAHHYCDGYNPNALPENIIHKELADIILFCKQGQATILKNNFHKRGHERDGKDECAHSIVPIMKINLLNIINGSNISYPLSCRKCSDKKNCHCFDHLPLPIRMMLLDPRDPSGVNSANCDNEYTNERFIHRK